MILNLCGGDIKTIFHPVAWKVEGDRVGDKEGDGDNINK